MAHTPPITITAFGKHPAWADHIDSLPAPGPCLPRFKSLLYTNGIAPNVQRWTRRPRKSEADEVSSQALDSDQADAEASLIRLDHLYSWYTPEALVIGKLAPSADEKGRRNYPFVLAVQCEEAEAQWVRHTLWPTLAPLARRCQETLERNALQEVLDKHAASLNEILTTTPPDDAAHTGNDTKQNSTPPEGLESLHALSRALAGPGEKPPETFLRFLYQIRRVTQAAQRVEDWPATHLRVPLISADRVDDITLWQNAACYMTRGKTSVLAIAPVDQGWIDLMLGPADTSHFLCLRQSNLPHCTEIAYTLSPTDRQTIHAILNGEPPLLAMQETGSGIFNRKFDPPNDPAAHLTLPPDRVISSDNTTGSTRGQPTSKKNRSIHLMLWGVAGLILLIITLLVILFQGA